LIDRFDGLVWRSVEYDYDGAEEAGRAADFAEEPEALLEEVGAEDGSVWTLLVWAV
jgi:hypothetical protein